MNFCLFIHFFWRSQFPFRGSEKKHEILINLQSVFYIQSNQLSEGSQKGLNPSQFGYLPTKQMEKFTSTALILLWTYTGSDKLIRWEDSRNAFHNQTFPSELAEVLTYVIPITELLIALLLLFSVTRWWGYLSSILLLTVFTTYVGLIWVGAFPRVPCNCAGILNSLGWAEHFFLNLGFIGMAVWCLGMERSGAVSYHYTEGPYRSKTDNSGKKEAKKPPKK